MNRIAPALLAAAFCSAAPALAWWDTVTTVARPFPLVREIEADTLPGLPPESLAADPQADGGRGGKAFLLKPGGLALTAELKGLQPRGLYVLFVLSRLEDGPPDISLLSLTVTEKATGEAKSWTLPIPSSPLYHASGRLYFPTPAGGDYTVSLAHPADASALRDFGVLPGVPGDDGPVTNLLASLQRKSYRPLRVDRLELRDVLGTVARKPAKTRRMLATDEEVSTLRGEFRAQAEAALAARKPLKLPSYPGPAVLDPAATPWWPRGRTPEERQARNDLLWNLLPDYNTVFSSRNPGLQTAIGHDRNGLAVDAALAYEKTGNAEFGWDAAILLCAVAAKWPALDFQVQSISQSGQGLTHPATNLFTFSQSPGKFVYRGWSGGTCEKLVRAYDRVFDFVKGNRELAQAVGRRIPWVKTPEDVLWLLDVHLLQASMDQCNRDWISGGDSTKVLIPLVQGPGPESDRMLDEGIFRKMCMNMTFRGGVDDQAVCSYNRDGVHYIGSVGYLGNDLLEIGDLLRRYVQAGGASRFDILDGGRYPHMRESEGTLRSVNNVAGGFPLIVGDARDMRVGRTAGAPVLPSRLLGGFATTLLESGPAGDPLAQRAAGLYAGIGRGHAHQDTLNIELFAHGCRVSPDLGGRHEGERRGSPNMRYNKVHNVVEVDDANFMNSYAGSTTAGTGWNTAYSPAPGSQFMEHRARATSHPQVTLYARQTALIDAGGRDSYLFDVFRVRGGSVHTWCFHGGRAKNEDFTVNAPIKEAASPDAVEYLRKHFEGTRREGTVPEVLQADWTLEPALQKHYQGTLYEEGKRVTTRLHLFGREGDRLYAGNASSTAYEYNFPMLYVRSPAAASNRESVFPALLEPFAGAPFILSRQALEVKGGPGGADAPAALAVELQGGITDLLFACSAPAGTAEAGRRLVTDGRFGHVRSGPEGPVLAHLVGGTRLEGAGLSLTLAKASHEGKIGSVDYAARRFTVEGEWPLRLLTNAAALIENDLHHEVFLLESLEKGPAGTTAVTHEKTAVYYQSVILKTDEKEGWIETEIEPPVFGCDTRFPDGTTVINEKGDVIRRVKFEEGDRWMDIGYPGYRGSFPDRIAWADLPDADGDGRRTLRLLSTPTNQILDVTRIADNGSLFYFKMPADPDYQRGGWQYAYRKLVNEDGSLTWLALYPGSSFRWKPEGGFKAADFADADGDGKAKLRACVFGPGDTVRVDTFAFAERLSSGQWSIRANAPCTIELPAGTASKIGLSRDGVTFTPAAANRVGNRLALALSESDLGDGRVILKLEP